MSSILIFRFIRACCMWAHHFHVSATGWSSWNSIQLASFIFTTLSLAPLSLYGAWLLDSVERTGGGSSPHFSSCTLWLAAAAAEPESSVQAAQGAALPGSRVSTLCVHPGTLLLELSGSLSPSLLHMYCSTCTLRLPTLHPLHGKVGMLQSALCVCDIVRIWWGEL